MVVRYLRVPLVIDMKPFHLSLLAAAILALPAVSVADTDASPYTVKMGVARIFARATSTDLKGTLPPYGVEVPAGNQLEVMPESTVLFTISRRLTDNWEAELVLGAPPTHDVKLRVGSETMGRAAQYQALAANGIRTRDQVAGYIATTRGITVAQATPSANALVTAAQVGKYNGATVARVEQAAPTAFINYRFFERGTTLRPYVGVGINYTRFKARETTAGANVYMDGPVDIKLSDSWGIAFQTGVTYRIDDKWSLNAGWMTASVKNKMTITTANGEQKASYRFHPSVYTVSVGYSF